MPLRSGYAIAALCILAVLTACTNAEPSGQLVCGKRVGDDFLPTEAGAEWTYDLTDMLTGQALGPKRHAIIDRTGNVVTFENKSVKEFAHRWLRHEGTRHEWQRNLRYFLDSPEPEPEKDQYYVPSALRLDTSHTTKDEPWDEPRYLRKTIDIAKCPDWDEARGEDNLKHCPAEALLVEEVWEHWTVIAVDERLSEVLERLDLEHDQSLILAMGDLPVLCHERTCPETGGCKEGTYCYARGVGKVYELSTDEREELSDYCLPVAPDK